MTLAHIEAALSDAMPSDCTCMSTAFDTARRFTVYLHWANDAGREVCAIGKGETLQAAYDAALIEKAGLIPSSCWETALQYEREGCN